MNLRRILFAGAAFLVALAVVTTAAVVQAQSPPPNIALSPIVIDDGGAESQPIAPVVVEQSAPVAPQAAAPPQAAPPVVMPEADVSGESSSFYPPSAGMASDAVVPWVVTEGLCQGQNVNVDTVRYSLQPNLQPETGEDGTVNYDRVIVDGQVVDAPEVTIQPSWLGLKIGDYTITLDPVAKQVEVEGPEGADLIERDIQRCIGGPGYDPSGKPYPTVGDWDWNGYAWRYVDKPGPARKQTPAK